MLPPKEKQKQIDKQLKGMNIIVSASNPKLLKNKKLMKACFEHIKQYNRDRAK